MRKFFVGIDVQVRSSSPYAVLDDDLNLVKSGWLQQFSNRFEPGLKELSS
jgi:hypothetical protein